MGLPEIIINFKTAGTTALRRSSRGSVALIVAGQGTDTVFTALSQADPPALGPRLYRMLRLCFLGTPAKVTLVYGGNGSDALDRARRAAFGGWICAPDMAASSAAAYIAGAKSGKDIRITVTTALKDPDSMNGEEERYSVSNVALEELPLVNYDTGKINQQTIRFRFSPGELRKLSGISVVEVA